MGSITSEPRRPSRWAWSRRAAGLAVSGLLLAVTAGAVFAVSPAPSTSSPPAASPSPTVSTSPAAGSSSPASSPAASAAPGALGNDSDSAAHKAACAAERQAAKSDPTVSTLRALGDCELARRFTTLTRLTAAVDGAKHLTSDHRSALLAIISRSQGELTSLQTTIDQDATVAALKVDLPKIATQVRVYLLVGPQVRLTRAADAGSAAIARLQQVAQRLQARIDARKAAGKDVKAAQAALDDLNHQVTLAAAQIDPVAGHVLPLQPADWNSGQAKPILDAARSSLKAARDEIQAAVKDAQACRADLGA